MIFNRSILSGAILQGKSFNASSIPAKITAKFWATFAIGYFIVAWLDLAYDLISENETRLPLIASAYIIILSVIVVYALVSYVIEQFFQRKRQVHQHKSTQQDEALLQGGR